MALSIEQLIALASGAGFSGPDLGTAVSIALAESGGNPQAYNPERAAGAAQGHGSYGLWQIYITAHPEYSAAQLLDPAYNAAAAFSVYQSAGNSFHPWSTFKNGAYLAHLDVVNATINPPSGDTTAGDGGGSGFDPSGGQMVGLLIGGAVLFFVLTRYL